MIVKFEYRPSWSCKGTMTVDLAALCESEGQKVNKQDDQGNWTDKKVLSYPISKVRKLFTLMVDNMQIDELNKVQTYLNSSSKKYAAVFKQIKEKGR